jgi:catalase-peroxidase
MTKNQMIPAIAAGAAMSPLLWSGALLLAPLVLTSGCAMSGGGEPAPGGGCPMMGGAHRTHRHTAAGAWSNRDWWPEQLHLQILHQLSPLANPMGEDFDYAAEVSKLDVAALRQDVEHC